MKIKTLNDKNYQAFSEKFRQIKLFLLCLTTITCGVLGISQRSYSFGPQNLMGRKKIPNFLLAGNAF